MKKIAYLFLVLVLLVISAEMLTGCRWVNTYMSNTIDYVDQKIDDRTNYDTRKTVEDSCRAMISSYESDKLTWMQYKNSEDSEQRSWGEQAKMRANRTASNYNNYILKNSYVWDGNIPSDIQSELAFLE